MDIATATLKSLTDGACDINSLHARVLDHGATATAKDVLECLHFLGEGHLVVCRKEDGKMLWELGDGEEPQAPAEPPKRRGRPPGSKNGGQNPKSHRRKEITVVERKFVPEVTVRVVNEGEVWIIQGETHERAEDSQLVSIPFDRVPALIEALKTVTAEQK
jgi:hypothetical protein